MSHRQPPEDRVPGLKFMGWVLLLMLVVGGLWWLLWEIVT